MNDVGLRTKLCAQNPFVVPVAINGWSTHALRDTGNSAPTFVDPCLVRPQNYTGESIVCRGAFTSKRSVPLAVVEMSCKALGCECSVPIVVGVCKMPVGVLCDIGNSLFQDYPQFTDFICHTAGDAKIQFLAGNGDSDVERHNSLVAAVTRAMKRKTERDSDHMSSDHTNGRGHPNSPGHVGLMGKMS